MLDHSYVGVYTSSFLNISFHIEIYIYLDNRVVIL